MNNSLLNTNSSFPSNRTNSSLKNSYLNTLESKPSSLYSEPTYFDFVNKELILSELLEAYKVYSLNSSKEKRVKLLVEEYNELLNKRIENIDKGSYIEHLLQAIENLPDANQDSQIRSKLMDEHFKLERENQKLNKPSNEALREIHSLFMKELENHLKSTSYASIKKQETKEVKLQETFLNGILSEGYNQRMANRRKINTDELDMKEYITKAQQAKPLTLNDLKRQKRAKQEADKGQETNQKSSRGL